MTSIKHIGKFADDTKIGNTANTADDIQNMQMAIDNLVKWSQTWGMTFNTQQSVMSCT